MKIVKVEVDFGDSCPKGHSKADVEVVDYEKVDLVETLFNVDIETLRTRKVNVYTGFCRVYCNICRRDYTLDCYIYEYGAWRKRG